jgi:hypothetical protein
MLVKPLAVPAELPTRDEDILPLSVLRDKAKQKSLPFIGEETSLESV